MKYTYLINMLTSHDAELKIRCIDDGPRAWEAVIEEGGYELVDAYADSFDDVVFAIGANVAKWFDENES